MKWTTCHTRDSLETSNGKAFLAAKNQVSKQRCVRTNACGRCRLARMSCSSMTGRGVSLPSRSTVRASRRCLIGVGVARGA